MIVEGPAIKLLNKNLRCSDGVAVGHGKTRAGTACGLWQVDANIWGDAVEELPDIFFLEVTRNAPQEDPIGLGPLWASPILRSDGLASTLANSATARRAAVLRMHGLQGTRMTRKPASVQVTSRLLGLRWCAEVEKCQAFVLASSFHGYSHRKDLWISVQHGSCELLDVELRGGQGKVLEQYLARVVDRNRRARKPRRLPPLALARVQLGLEAPRRRGRKGQER
mmetsp:Transcript_2529/g.7412  ORF Transcript_2529/g.7412 Transcript_2529/m.7412 type:complete len:224 (-) Transcript_2529:625-1296(-)